MPHSGKMIPAATWFCVRLNAFSFSQIRFAFRDLGVGQFSAPIAGRPNGGEETPRPLQHDQGVGMAAGGDEHRPIVEMDFSQLIVVDPSGGREYSEGLLKVRVRLLKITKRRADPSDNI